MNIKKEQIEQKIDTVIRQYSKINKFGGAPLRVYIPILHDIQRQIFSKDNVIQKEGLRRFKNLLFSPAWDNEYWNTYSDQKDKYKDRFIDDFNNWYEWEDFLKDLAKDVEEYHDTRLKNLDDSRET